MSGDITTLVMSKKKMIRTRVVDYCRVTNTSGNPKHYEREKTVEKAEVTSHLLH